MWKGFNLDFAALNWHTEILFQSYSLITKEYLHVQKPYSVLPDEATWLLQIMCLIHITSDLMTFP
jgi:hypothetical protein